MDPLTLGLILLGASLIVLLLEMFIPSGGILGITACVLALAGVVFLFRHDTSAGIGGFFTVLVLGPLIGWFMIKTWPNTPMGRRLINAPTEEEQLAQRQGEEQQRQARAALVGKQGRAVTDLRPVGLAEIEGQRLEVLAETHYVPAGSAVRVTSADLMQVKVRRA